MKNDRYRDESSRYNKNLEDDRHNRKERNKYNHHNNRDKRSNEYYIFPSDDKSCTESQLNVMYCANWGRKDHHFSEWRYDNHQLFQNYQRKSYLREKINRSNKNASREYGGNNDFCCFLIENSNIIYKFSWLLNYPVNFYFKSINI